MAINYKAYKDDNGEIYRYREGSTQDTLADNDSTLIRTPGADKIVSNDETVDETPVQVSQIQNFNNEVSNLQTVTSLQLVGNILRYTNEDGVEQDINLSLYLDDTNAAFIVSGVINASGIITFTRDDNSTFDVDASTLLDDQNASEVPFSPAGNTTSTNVQSAIEELQTNIDNVESSIFTDHDQLLGLTDDDHPQYLNNSRGDIRYYQKSELDNGQLDSRYFTETEINNQQQLQDNAIANNTTNIGTNNTNISALQNENSTQQTEINQNTTNNSGSVDIHSDMNLDGNSVDLTGSSSGDVLVLDNGVAVPRSIDFGFTLFGAEFEENGGLGNNQYEWSIGNGSTGSRIGYIVPENCEFYKMAINVDSANTGASVSINIRRAPAGTTDVLNSPIAVTPIFTANNQIQNFTPIQLNEGDILIPQTNTVNGTWNDVRIYLYFRRIATSSAAKTVISSLGAQSVTFNSTTFQDIPGLSGTITLTRPGSLIGDLIYSAARSGAANAVTEFRVVVNEDNGQSFNDTLSTFNDTGAATHFLNNVPAGTYTISAQALTNQPILIASAGLKLTAKED